MRWSWQLGTVRGIAIRIHVTLLALFVWVLASFAWQAGWVAALLGLALVASVFGIIVVHELAHALVARRFGCVTRDILLLPIGGMARMERMPERPLHELLVAIAGPLVNLVLAGLLAAGLALAGGSLDPEQAVTIGGSLAAQLLWINVSLAAFNLLPALPMDGGRVLRAALAMRMPRPRATRIASVIARLCAVGFVLAGLSLNPLLVVIGLFVWFGAQQESADATLREALGDVTVERAMLRLHETVEPDEPVAVTAGRMLAEGRDVLPVVDHGHLVGVVTAADIARAHVTSPASRTAAEVMRRDVPVLAPGARLASALEAFGRADVAIVADADVPVGLLTPDRVAAYAALAPSLRARPGLAP